MKVNEVDEYPVMRVVPDELATPRMIRVWRFEDAPEGLRKLSTHGGDEDWLAIVPPGVEVPDWMQSGTYFGVCEVSQVPLANGATLCIGAHA